MIACVDVHYRDDLAVAACVFLEHWTDNRPASESVEPISPTSPYQPGQFSKRELPPILQILARAPCPIHVVVVDGYVWLDADGSPGLGARVYQTFAGRIPVVGVAKSSFKTADFARQILRGRSRRPLYITAAGIAPEIAAQYVFSMHGPHRIPDMLKRVDQLCRNS